MKLNEVILRGTRSAQPAAATSNNGFLYFVTDEGVTERSNGSAWQSYSGSSGGGSAAGDDTQIQFSISGAFAADAGLTYDPNPSGSFTVTAKDADTDANGGDLLLTAGNGNGTGGGGSLVVIAGDGTGEGAGGGIVLIAGSAEAGDANGGDIHISAGDKSGSGQKGVVKFGDADGNIVYTGLNIPTYASIISLDVSINNAVKIVTTDEVGDCTINASAAGVAGKQLFIMIENPGDVDAAITYGTHFLNFGILTVAAGTFAVMHFISDGSRWYQIVSTLDMTE